MPGTSAASVNPTSAKRSFVADIMTFLFATTFAKETRLASFRHRRNPPPFGVRKVDKLLEVHGVHDEPGVKSVEVAEALAIELREMAAWMGHGEVRVLTRSATAKSLRECLASQI
jgi:hypothetical protein